MERLKNKVYVGLVGGSDLPKILEQLGGDSGAFAFLISKVYATCHLLNKYFSIG